MQTDGIEISLLKRDPRPGFLMMISDESVVAEIGAQVDLEGVLPVTLPGEWTEGEPVDLTLELGERQERIEATVVVRDDGSMWPQPNISKTELRCLLERLGAVSGSVMHQPRSAPDAADLSDRGASPSPGSESTADASATGGTKRSDPLAAQPNGPAQPGGQSSAGGLSKLQPRGFSGIRRSGQSSTGTPIPDAVGSDAPPFRRSRSKPGADAIGFSEPPRPGFRRTANPRRVDGVGLTGAEATATPQSDASVPEGAATASKMGDSPTPQPRSFRRTADRPVAEGIGMPSPDVSHPAPDQQTTAPPPSSHRTADSPTAAETPMPTPSRRGSPSPLQSGLKAQPPFVNERTPYGESEPHGISVSQPVEAVAVVEDASNLDAYFDAPSGTAGADDRDSTLPPPAGFRSGGFETPPPRVSPTNGNTPVVHHPEVPVSPLTPTPVPPTVASSTPVTGDSTSAYLDSLNLSPQPIIAGDAMGTQAVEFAQQSAPPADSYMLVAQSMSEDMSWYLVLTGGRVVSGYRLPTESASSLTTLVSRAGLIDDAGAEKVARVGKELKISEAEAMTVLGLLDEDQLARIVRAHARLVVKDLCGHGQVRYRLHIIQDAGGVSDMPRVSTAPAVAVPAKPSPAPPVPQDASDETVPPGGEGRRNSGDDLGAPSEEPLGDNLRAHIDRTAKKKITALQATQRARSGRCPALQVPLNEAVRRGALKPDERAFVTSYLNGKYTLREIFQASPLGKRRIHAIVFTFEQAGLLAFAKPNASAKRAAKLREEVTTQHELLAEADHFEFMGLHWTATQVDFEKAKNEYMKRFSEKRLQALDESLQVMAAEIRERIGTVYRRMIGRGARQEYRSELVDTFEIAQAVMLLEQQLEMATYRSDPDQYERLMDELRELSPRAAANAKKSLMERHSAKRSVEEVEILDEDFDF